MASNCVDYYRIQMDFFQYYTNCYSGILEKMIVPNILRIACNNEYDFTIRRNITIIRSKSAMEKTTLVDIINDDKRGCE